VIVGLLLVLMALAGVLKRLPLSTASFTRWSASAWGRWDCTCSRRSRA
jgi:hypothetical protein